MRQFSFPDRVGHSITVAAMTMARHGLKANPSTFLAARNRPRPASNRGGNHSDSFIPSRPGAGAEGALRTTTARKQILIRIRRPRLRQSSSSHSPFKGNQNHCVAAVGLGGNVSRAPTSPVLTPKLGTNVTRRKSTCRSRGTVPTNVASSVMRPLKKLGMSSTDLKYGGRRRRKCGALFKRLWF